MRYLALNVSWPGRHDFISPSPVVYGILFSPCSASSRYFSKPSPQRGLLFSANASAAGSTVDATDPRYAVNHRRHPQFRLSLCNNQPSSLPQSLVSQSSSAFSTSKHSSCSRKSYYTPVPAPFHILLDSLTPQFLSIAANQSFFAAPFASGIQNFNRLFVLPRHSPQSSHESPSSVRSGLSCCMSPIGVSQFLNALHCTNFFIRHRRHPHRQRDIREIRTSHPAYCVGVLQELAKLYSFHLSVPTDPFFR